MGGLGEEEGEGPADAGGTTTSTVPTSRSSQSSLASTVEDGVGQAHHNHEESMSLASDGGRDHDGGVVGEDYYVSLDRTNNTSAGSHSEGMAGSISDMLSNREEDDNGDDNDQSLSFLMTPPLIVKRKVGHGGGGGGDSSSNNNHNNNSMVGKAGYSGLTFGGMVSSQRELFESMSSMVMFDPKEEIRKQLEQEKKEKEKITVSKGKAVFEQLAAESEKKKTTKELHLSGGKKQKKDKRKSPEDNVPSLEELKQSKEKTQFQLTVEKYSRRLQQMKNSNTTEQAKDNDKDDNNRARSEFISERAKIYEQRRKASSTTKAPKLSPSKLNDGVGTPSTSPAAAAVNSSSNSNQNPSMYERNMTVLRNVRARRLPRSSKPYNPPSFTKTRKQESILQSATSNSFLLKSIMDTTATTTTSALTSKQRRKTKSVSSDLDDTTQHISKFILDAFEPVEAKAGDTIVHQGDMGQHFYVVEEGQVDFTINGQIVGSAFAGDTFGETNLLGHGQQEIAAVISSSSSSTMTNTDEQGGDIDNSSRTVTSKLLRLDQESYRGILQSQRRLYIPEEERDGENEEPVWTNDAESTKDRHAWLKDSTIVQERQKLSTAIVNQSVGLDDLQKISLLGEGQFGQVWRVSAKIVNVVGGVELLRKCEFALKTQIRINDLSEDLSDEINDEITIMKQFSTHPFIANLLHTYEDPTSIHMLMTLIEGNCELWDIIHKRKDIDGLKQFALTEDHVRFYTLSIVDTLSYIHDQHYVYRDLKPENIMIDHTGYPIIVDFGFAKKLGRSPSDTEYDPNAPDADPETPMTYTFCGTPNYVAPEVVLQTGHNRSVDYWALGIIVYEMLTTKNPFYFEGMDTVELYKSVVEDEAFPLPDEGVSNDVRMFVNALLEKEPQGRLGMLSPKSTSPFSTRSSTKIGGGVQDVLDHSWFAALYFQGITLDQIRLRQVDPPFIPPVSRPVREKQEEEEVVVDITDTKELPSHESDENDRQGNNAVKEADVASEGQFTTEEAQDDEIEEIERKIQTQEDVHPKDSYEVKQQASLFSDSAHASDTRVEEDAVEKVDGSDASLQGVQSETKIEEEAALAKEDSKDVVKGACEPSLVDDITGDKDAIDMSPSGRTKQSHRVIVERSPASKLRARVKASVGVGAKAASPWWQDANTSDADNDDDDSSPQRKPKSSSRKSSKPKGSDDDGGGDSSSEKVDKKRRNRKKRRSKKRSTSPAGKKRGTSPPGIPSDDLSDASLPANKIKKPSSMTDLGLSSDDDDEAAAPATTQMKKKDKSSSKKPRSKKMLTASDDEGGNNSTKKPLSKKKLSLDSGDDVKNTSSKKPSSKKKLSLDSDDDLKNAISKKPSSKKKLSLDSNDEGGGGSKPSSPKKPSSRRRLTALDSDDDDIEDDDGKNSSKKPSSKKGLLGDENTKKKKVKKKKQKSSKLPPMP